MGLESRHLGDMLHYLRVKFGGNRRSKWVTFHLKKEKIQQNYHFWKFGE